MSAPSCAKQLATAAPTPRLAPVTSATLPSRMPMIYSLRRHYPDQVLRVGTALAPSQPPQAGSSPVYCTTLYTPRPPGGKALM